jgi:hypothetical protein
MTIPSRITAKALLMVVALVSLQACTPATGTEYNAVVEAYNTSGVTPTTPYTRTIFSSHNF